MGVTTECEDHLHSSALESSSREVGRPEAGVSLPPRKRLLAGMKQNGLLPSPSCTSSPTTSSAWPSALTSAKDPTAEVKLEVDLEGTKMATNFAVLEEGEEIKMGDGDTDQDALRNGGHEGAGPRSRSPSRATKQLARVETKPGMSKEARQGHLPYSSAGESQEDRVELDLASSSAKRKAVHRHELAEAAKLTAAMAAKSAAKAKATAAEKAAAAAKAAAVAKAALDAAAAAEEAGSQIVDSSGRYSRAGEEAELVAPIDDEEMARQLHRAINSSPRITRSHIALVQRKAEKFMEVNTAMGGVSAKQVSAQGKHARRTPSSSNEFSNLEARPSRRAPKRSQNWSLEADKVPVSARPPSQREGDGDSTAAFQENACTLNKVAVRHPSEEVNMDSRIGFVTRKICTVGDDQD